MAIYALRIRGLTPDTLPLAKLGSYCQALAELFGTQEGAFLERVVKGSAVLKVHVPDESRDRLETRVKTAPAAEPGSEVSNGYLKLVRLLRADQTSAEVRPWKGKPILSIIGKPDADFTSIPTIREHGEINGRVIRIGGRDSTIPVALQTPDGEVINCTASIQIALALRAYLLEPIDLILAGVGAYRRSDDGHWKIDGFTISSFTTLDSTSFDQVIKEVRSQGSGWDNIDDPDSFIEDLRYGI